jgi:glycosyltransferase involved in cell wall biosynthesis
VKVLHVNDYGVMGGCEVLMHLTVARLAAQGHETETFTADEIPDYRRTPLNYIDSRRARGALLARLRAFEPDVVHLHNFYHLLSPGILATLDRWRRGHPCRVVMTAHDFHLVCPNPALRHYRGGEPVLADPERAGRLPGVLFTRWDHRGHGHGVLRVAQHLWNYRLWRRRRRIDVCICPSRFMQSVLDAGGLPTVFVPNPAPPAATGSFVKPDRLHLVFAGRIDPEKGLAPFLAALPPTFDGTMTVVGEGDDEETCRSIVNRRGLDDRVTFVGRLPRDETIERIEGAHVVVLPSRWYENAPVLLLEALSRRASILVSDLGGMREIVRTSGVGYAFDPDDPSTLRSALGRIATDFAEGRLNDFDASAFLADRSEERYLERVLAVYADRASGAD